MKLNRYQDTHSLSFDLCSAAGEDAGKIVGIDIQHTSARIDLSSIESTDLSVVHRIA